jgi:ubiquinone/menaquinone biosynthesis C-methylase UbiE
MVKTIKVKDHFDKMAPVYESLSNRFPWQWLRHRETQTLLSLLGDVMGKEVLEFGCGAGHYSNLLLNAGACRLWVVDLSQEMLDQISESQITKICGDASCIKLDRQFSVAVSAGLFEFVDDCPKTLKNLARHVERGGNIVILYPLRGFLGSVYRLVHYLDGLNIRVFSVREFQILAEDAGMQLVNTEKCGLFSAVSLFRRQI